MHAAAAAAAAERHTAFGAPLLPARPAQSTTERMRDMVLRSRRWAMPHRPCAARMRACMHVCCKPPSLQPPVLWSQTVGWPASDMQQPHGWWLVAPRPALVSAHELHQALVEGAVKVPQERERLRQHAGVATRAALALRASASQHSTRTGMHACMGCMGWEPGPCHWQWGQSAKWPTGVQSASRVGWGCTRMAAMCACVWPPCGWVVVRSGGDAA